MEISQNIYSFIVWGMGLKNQCIFIFSSWLIWNFGWCHLGIFDFTVKYVYTFRYLCTFCGSSEHRDNSKKKVDFFLWVKRVKKYEYRELTRALDLSFSHFKYELYFHFLKLIKENSKTISNWNKKGSTELWNPKKGQFREKVTLFLPKC